MHNGKIADVIPITSASASRQHFGTFESNGGKIKVTHVRDKVRLTVTSLVMRDNDFEDCVLTLEFDAETALAFQVATGLAAIGAKSDLDIDDPEGVR
ncbi:hypothetical protein [Nonomuraea basaltis]|uniref:hypothetical protein n=1 Tax=Nonomuraea basaltis TaxID=2495887 RepID=UPI00110C64C6|nr:hypothetical protein [Nonomuraea basaltis]TMR92394.1 hypothetical protein EJK15_44720 [Nonomuraea basaltis]